MKKLWVVFFSLMVSPLWAATETNLMGSATETSTSVSATASPTENASVTTALPTAVIPVSTSVVTPVLTNSSTVMPAVTVSAIASATPSATVALPKPPSLTMSSSTPTENTPSGERFQFQFDGGTVSGVSSAAATQLGLGLGLDGRISYAFDDFFSIGLESGFYNLSLTSATVKSFGFPTTATANTSHIPILVVFQIGLGDQGGPIQPYLILGAGMALDFDNVQGASFAPGTTSSWANFEFDPGLGVAFVLNKGLNLFIQGKIDMDFDNNTAGTTGQTSDTPILFVPVQLGLNFNL